MSATQDPMGDPPFVPYAVPTARPDAWAWFAAYAFAMAAMYLAVAVLGVVVPWFAGQLDSGDAVALVIMAIVSLPLAAGFAIGPLLARRPWVWVYGLVLICIGLTSPCCMPASIPLLILWLKPEMKAYYGRLS